jgi:hypothetical protein
VTTRDALLREYFLGLKKVQGLDFQETDDAGNSVNDRIAGDRALPPASLITEEARTIATAAAAALAHVRLAFELEREACARSDYDRVSAGYSSPVPPFGVVQFNPHDEAVTPGSRLGGKNRGTDLQVLHAVQRVPVDAVLVESGGNVHLELRTNNEKTIGKALAGLKSLRVYIKRANFEEAAELWDTLRGATAARDKISLALTEECFPDTVLFNPGRPVARGVSLLWEYFCLPQKFLFLELDGLGTLGSVEEMAVQLECRDRDGTLIPWPENQPRRAEIPLLTRCALVSLSRVVEHSVPALAGSTVPGRPLFELEVGGDAIRVDAVRWKAEKIEKVFSELGKNDHGSFWQEVGDLRVLRFGDRLGLALHPAPSHEQQGRLSVPIVTTAAHLALGLERGTSLYVEGKAVASLVEMELGLRIDIPDVGKRWKPQPPSRRSPSSWSIGELLEFLCWHARKTWECAARPGTRSAVRSYVLSQLETLTELRRTQAGRPEIMTTAQLCPIFESVLTRLFELAGESVSVKVGS